MSTKMQNVTAAIGAVLFVAMIAATYGLTSGVVTAKVAAATKPVVVAQR